LVIGLVSSIALKSMAMWKGMEQERCSPHGSQEAERGMIWGPEIPFKVMPPVTYFL
jgi:hypothetical protein